MFRYVPFRCAAFHMWLPAELIGVTRTACVLELDYKGDSTVQKLLSGCITADSAGYSCPDCQLEAVQLVAVPLVHCQSKSYIIRFPE